MDGAGKRKAFFFPVRTLCCNTAARRVERRNVERSTLGAGAQCAPRAAAFRSPLVLDCRAMDILTQTDRERSSSTRRERAVDVPILILSMLHLARGKHTNNKNKATAPLLLVILL